MIVSPIGTSRPTGGATAGNGGIAPVYPPIPGAAGASSGPPSPVDPATGQGATWLIQLLNQLRDGVVSLWYSCTTAQRPNDPYLGQIIFDTTAGALFYCDTIRNAATATPAHWTQVGTGGGGGTVTSITATSPIQVTPSPITGTGDIEHVNSGVTAATYGDATHVAQVAVNATGHVTSASNVAINTLASPLTTKGDVWTFSTVDTRQPIGADATVATADSAQTTGWKWAPIPTVGKLQSVEFTTPGTFTWNVPSGVTGARATEIGGGGGGSCTIAAATGGGGGGSGEVVEDLPFACTSGGTVTVVVGAKGTGGVTGQASAQPGVAGGDTSITSNGIQYFARGGKGGTTAGASGAGGGINGGASRLAGGSGGLVGTGEAPVYFGGNSGGGGGASTTAPGAAGAGAAGYATGAAGGAAASSQAGGGGGANTVWGAGGAGGNGGATGTSAAAGSYGAGGGGAGGHAGTTLAAGDGAGGYVMIVWVA